MKIEMTQNKQIIIKGTESELSVIDGTGFFTKHPSRVNAYYCLYNNYTIRYFKKYLSWYLDNVEGFNDVLLEFDDYLDYPEKKQFSYKRLDFPGITLKDYQEYCLDLMLHYKKQCIFAGPGTGKTLMALTYLNTVAANEEGGTHVIVMPKNIMKQYQEEANKYLPEKFRVFNSPKKFEVSHDHMHNLLIINYESLHKVNKMPLDTIIFDESHSLKNYTSTANNEAERLVELTDSIYLFTGTPLDKNRFELFAQLKLLIPYAFPTKTSVLFRYFTVDDYYKPNKEIPERRTEGDEIIKRLCYGLDSEEVLDLPPMKNYILEVRFKNKSLYTELTKEGILKLPEGIVLAETSAALRTKQRQLCTGFIFTDDKVVVRTENPKEEALRIFLTKVTTSIIFTQFNPEIDTVSEMCEELGRTYGVVSGHTKDNNASIEGFKAGELDILIMQIQSGSAGLDLSITNNILFYALPESAVVLKQARYRIRRIGQTKPCNYFYIVTKGTVEKQRVIKNLNIKRETHVKEFEIFRRKK